MKFIRHTALFLLVVIVSSTCGDHITGYSIPESTPESLLEGVHLTKIVVDKRGIVWVGSFSEGLYRIEGNSIENFPQDHPVFQPGHIWDMDIDSQDNIWIGTGNGLIKYDRTGFTKYNTENSPMLYNHVQNLAIDHNDNVWFSSAISQSGGIMKHDGTTWEVFTPENSILSGNLIYAIYVDDRNSIWINSFGQSIVKIVNNSWSSSNLLESGIHLPQIDDFFQDNEGQLYAWRNSYSYSGPIQNEPHLIVNKGQGWHIDNPSDSLGQEIGRIYAMTVDSGNRIWAAFRKYSGPDIYYRENDKWIPFDSLGISVRGMAFDPNGWLYVVGDGLHIYKNQKVQ